MTKSDSDQAPGRATVDDVDSALDTATNGDRSVARRNGDGGTNDTAEATGHDGTDHDDADRDGADRNGGATGSGAQTDAVTASTEADLTDTETGTDTETSDNETSDNETSDAETSGDGSDTTRVKVGTNGVAARTESEGATDAHQPDGGGFFSRLFARPIHWINSPWPRERTVKFFLGTLPALVIPTVIMILATQFGPTINSTFPYFHLPLGLQNNTPTGGDFGAHVWGPNYLQNHVLTSGWYNGWSMDWYAGLPAYRFYMVVPALMMVVANFVLPYGVAMKLVSVLGVIAIPAMCWAFGRLANFRYPMPEVFAFAGLAFVLDDSWGIYGGNLKSTMAGEFSFSIALALAILGLGVYARGLQTGKYRVWSAVILSIAAVSHGLVLIFIALAAIMFSLVWIDKARLKYIIPVGIATLLLSAWWVVPFIANHTYMTDMKYTPEPAKASFNDFWAMYFPLPVPLDILMTSLALFGIAFGAVRRNLNAIALGGLYFLLAFLVWLTSSPSRQLPMLGLLWNPRLLPFFYLCRNLLMAYGAVELLVVFRNVIRNRTAQHQAGYAPMTVFSWVFSVTVLLILGFMYQVLPGGQLVQMPNEDSSRYQWGPILSTPTNKKAEGSGWARYNFKGYEGQAKYPEYAAVVTTMADLGAKYGCGRALWENSADNGAYGTTMALMLLPYWTDGCIGSMEGLYFEASGTTPYHFLTAAAMSEKSSNPVRKLRYVDKNATVGVEHLQDLGVRFAMLRTDEAKGRAAEQPELTEVATSGPWTIYMVGNSDIVVPLDVQPVVVNPRDGDQRERLLENGTSWFQNKSDWAAMPADDGPKTWQRIDVAVDESLHEDNGSGETIRVDVVKPVEEIKVIQEPEATVSNYVQHDQSLSFDVDKTGVPILVRVSYFPNWQAKGAEGPYRIGPNMMVVIPTSNHVEMEFQQSALDYFSVLLSLLGIALCIAMRRQGDVDVPRVVFGAELERRDERRADDAARAIERSYQAQLILTGAGDSWGAPHQTDVRRTVDDAERAVPDGASDSDRAAADLVWRRTVASPSEPGKSSEPDTDGADDRAIAGPESLDSSDLSTQDEDR